MSVRIEDTELQFVDRPDMVGSKYYATEKLAKKLNLDKKIEFKAFATPRNPDKPNADFTSVLVTEAFALHCGIKSPPEAEGVKPGAFARKHKRFRIYSHNVEFEAVTYQDTSLKAMLYFVSYWGSKDACVRTKRTWYRINGKRVGSATVKPSGYSNVYFMYCEEANAVKIGVAKDLGKRLASLQIGNPYLITPLAYIECHSQAQAKALERQFHSKYRNLTMKGEWFKVEGELKSYLKI